MDHDEQSMHTSIHAEYRQALADAQWALANANARIKVQAAQIETLQQAQEPPK